MRMGKKADVRISSERISRRLPCSKNATPIADIGSFFPEQKSKPDEGTARIISARRFLSARMRIASPCAGRSLCD